MNIDHPLHDLKETVDRVLEEHPDNPQGFRISVPPALMKALQDALNDVDRVQFIEDSHTLHNALEFLYVVDGFECQRTYDDNPRGDVVRGETIREAIDKIMVTP